MRRVTLRLPEDLVAAYDDADGNRSAVMRRRLAEAVTAGEVTGIDEDLRALAEAEEAKDKGRLSRKRGTFRKRCHSFFGDQWKSGAVTPTDAEDMSESWATEATIYGSEYLAFLNAVVDWYAEHWSVHDVDRPQWPGPGVFIARSDPDAVDIDSRLVETMADARDRGMDRDAAVKKVSVYHPDAKVERAAREVW